MRWSRVHYVFKSITTASECTHTLKYVILAKCDLKILWDCRHFIEKSFVVLKIDFALIATIFICIVIEQNFVVVCNN